jgi:subtilase family serine protease
VNGKVIDTCKVPPLEKYVTFECKSWWKYQCPVTLTFTADSTNTNDEINENNNESDKYVYPCTTKKFSRDLLKSIPAKKK